MHLQHQALVIVHNGAIVLMQDEPFQSPCRLPIRFDPSQGLWYRHTVSNIVVVILTLRAAAAITIAGGRCCHTVIGRFSFRRVCRFVWVVVGGGRRIRRRQRRHLTVQDGKCQGKVGIFFQRMNVIGTFFSNGMNLLTAPPNVVFFVLV